MNSEKPSLTTESTQVSRRAAIQRGLRKGGMVAAPVLMSTLGQSAMAAYTPAKVAGKALPPSGFHSINASRPQIACAGKMPSEWITSSGNTKFKDIFGSSTKIANNVTIRSTLEAAAGTPPDASEDMKVAGYIAAAYYNAVNKLSDQVLPVESASTYVNASVMAIWRGYVAGNYKPRAEDTVAWTSADIIEYLQSTMD